MKQRLVCPRNGETAWCFVCKEEKRHRREEWATAAECETHGIALVPAKEVTS